jgi:hypothetical protein
MLIVLQCFPRLRVPRAVNITITTIQLLQFVVLTTVNYMAAKFINSGSRALY